MSSLGIAIQGGRYVKIGSTSSPSAHNVRLQTLDPKQDSAKLVFTSFRRGRPVKRFTHKVDGLKQTGEEPALIRLNVERISGNRWFVMIRSPGGIEELRIRTGLPRWPLLLLLVLLGGFSLWFFGLKGGENSGFNRLFGGAQSSESRFPNFDNEAENGGPNGPEEPGLIDSLGESEESRGSAEPSDSGAVSEKIGEDPLDGDTAAGDSELASVGDVLNRTVYFQAESARLSDETLKTLDALLARISGGVELDIGGHCAAYGTERGRIQLSNERARVVKEYLLNGLDDVESVRAQGYGMSRPATRDPDQQQLNRRVEIEISIVNSL